MVHAILKKAGWLLALAFYCATSWGSGIYNPGSSGGGGGGGTSVYPATATASFPFGFSASSGAFTSTVTVPSGATASEAVNFLQAGWISAYSNILINGGMEFYQRGPSFTVTTSSNGVYVMDRWYQQQGAGSPSYNCTISKSGTHVDTGLTSMNVNCSAAGSSSPGITLGQKVENYWDYAGSSVTFSMRVWLDQAPGAGNQPQVQIVDSNGSTAKLAPSGTTTGVWQTATVTRFIQTGITSLEFRIQFFTLGTGSLYYFDSGMAVRGDQTVPFVARPYEAELTLCQRYYEKSYAINTTPGTNTGPTDENTGYFAGALFNTNTTGGYVFYKAPKFKGTGTISFWTEGGVSGQWVCKDVVNNNNTPTMSTTIGSGGDTNGFGWRQASGVFYYCFGAWSYDAEM